MIWATGTLYLAFLYAVTLSVLWPPHAYQWAHACLHMCSQRDHCDFFSHEVLRQRFGGGRGVGCPGLLFYDASYTGFVVVNSDITTPRERRQTEKPPRGCSWDILVKLWNVLTAVALRYCGNTLPTVCGMLRKTKIVNRNSGHAQR